MLTLDLSDLQDYCKHTFQGWGEEAEGEGLTRVWTGWYFPARLALWMPSKLSFDR